MGSSAALRNGLKPRSRGAAAVVSLATPVLSSLASALISSHRLGGSEWPRLAQGGDQLLERESALGGAAHSHAPGAVGRRRQSRRIDLTVYENERAAEELLAHQLAHARRAFARPRGDRP